MCINNFYFRALVIKTTTMKKMLKSDEKLQNVPKKAMNQIRMMTLQRIPILAKILEVEAIEKRKRRKSFLILPKRRFEDLSKVFESLLTLLKGFEILIKFNKIKV